MNGAVAGLGYDAIESTQKSHEKQLASLRLQNDLNTQQLAELQYRLDRAITSDTPVTIHQVYFDPEATNLKSGAVANLEGIADALRTSPHAYVINVDGHADDGGTAEYNERLAEARARNVAAYLGGRGISMGQIRVHSYGATRPLASNATPEGRQLNRRVDVYIAKQ